MTFKAKSSREVDGHECVCYGRSLDVVRRWAQLEAKAGFTVTLAKFEDVVVEIVKPEGGK